MSLEGFFTKEIRSFRGSWTSLDQVEHRPDRAFLARNVRIVPGMVQTHVKSRDGYVAALTSLGKVTSMFHWVTSALSRLIYFDNGAVRMKNLATADPTETLLTLAGRAASAAEASDKAYFTVFTDTGLGAGQARFVNPAIVGIPVDKAFSAPYTTAPVLADNGAGLVTAGAHRWGYIVESRSGHLGQPSPQPADVFTPVSFTVAAGGRTVRMTFTLSVSAAPVVVHPIMTREDNLDVWFRVTDAEYEIGVNGSIPVTIDISQSDEDLANRALSAMDNFDRLAQTTAGTGPFNPSVVIPYGNRMCYIVDTKCYISDPYEYEVMTEAESAIQLPGKKRIVTGFPLRGSLYLLGPGWTHGCTDTGGRPRTWTPPEEVSGNIGSNSVLGVCWKTAGDYAWVVDESGLYAFIGRYERQPVSYMNTFWDRINWAVPNAVQVVDDVERKTVYVIAPLDSATEPTHALTWRYADGLGADVVDFCYDDFASPSTFSSLAMVQDPATGDSAMWVGPPAAGSILKQSIDSHNDNGQVIADQYETAYLLTSADKRGRINRFRALGMDARGSGTLSRTAYGKGRVLSSALPSHALSAAPGTESRASFDLKNENCSIRFGTGGLNQWFELLMVRPHWKPYLTNR